MTNDKKVMAAVRTLRERLGMTQTEFGKALGKGLSTVLRYETLRPPRGHMLSRLGLLAQENHHADLVGTFMDAWRAENPLPVHITMPVNEAQNDLQWLLMALANRLGRDYHFTELWKPYIDLLEPVWKELIGKGELEAARFEAIVQQMLEMDDARQRSLKSGKPTATRNLKPWRAHTHDGNSK